jgi:pyruvate formate lyase activating enzyme
MFMDFVSGLLKRLKSEGINTLIETSGFFDLDKFVDLVIPYIDIIYYDIKLIDNTAHKKFCGVPNELILSNFRALTGISAERGIELLPRTPLVPGITDTGENLDAIAAFLSELNINRAALLPYNPLWRDKGRKLGLDLYTDKMNSSGTWQSKEEVERCREIFQKYNIDL